MCIEDSILFKYPFFPNWSTDLMQSHSKSNQTILWTYKIDPNAYMEKWTTQNSQHNIEEQQS